MLYERDESRTLTTTVTGEKIAMGIDAGAMQHIMNIMTDLYSDPEAAIIREYSTNGLDAQIEAGFTPGDDGWKPIEVDTPSALSPFLSIRDYGVGLSIEDIHSIYSQYGASTKRGTNDQVGMLGLGCKSALTYAQQFTVVSVKDGVKINVAITREDDGSGSMTVVDTVSTDEPNGVKVVIPTAAGNTIERKARHFFSFWGPGTVLLDGSDPSGLGDDLLHLNDTVALTTESRQSYCVMGNVAYPIENNRLNRGNLNYNIGIVLRVPIGAVNFTPSREALHYTPRTIETLRAATVGLDNLLKDAIQRKLDACETPAEALKAMFMWRGVSRSAVHMNFTYKGSAIPRAYEVPNASDGSAPIVLTTGQSHVLSRHQRTRAVQAEIWPGTVWVYGYDRPTFTAGQKKKLNKWADDNGRTPTHYALVKDKPVSDYLDAGNMVPWATIEAIRLPRAASTSQGASGRIPGSYDVFTSGAGTKHGVPSNDIDVSNGIYYVEDANIWRGIYNVRDLVAKFLPGASVVGLASNRIDKFCRTFPEAKPLFSVLAEKKKAWWATVNDDQKKALVLRDNGSTNDLSLLAADRVNDPDLKAQIKLAAMDITALMNLRSEWRYVPSRDLDTPTFDSILRKRYPLFDRYNFRDHRDHTYLYLNAVYAATTTTKGA